MRFVGLSGALLALLAGLAAAAGAESPRLIDFELQDQFDRTYRDADYAGRVLYVVASDGEEIQCSFRFITYAD